MWPRLRFIIVIVGVAILGGCVERRGSAGPPAATPATQPSDFENEMREVARLEEEKVLHPRRIPLHTRPADADRDLTILDVAIRQRLRHAERDTTVFISVGGISVIGPGRWEDPPAELLKRLSDLPLKFKPVSMARMPKKDEMESPSRLRGVEDPTTGKRTPVYWAQIVGWESDTRVHVDSGEWSGPLGGGGGIDIFELRDGKWIWVKGGIHWVS